jgi:2-phosphoglycolate phosphatase
VIDRRFPRLVLFDLDGTLLDSAPDFVATLNRMRAQQQLPPMPMEALRPHVSRGARAMLTAGFASLDPSAIDALIPPFLQIYQQELSRHGHPFDGIESLLAAIESAGSRWGIVTNKPEYLARQLLPLLGWETRCAILIGGDTLAARKPDPLPLLHCAQVLDERIDDCVYIGDDERDIAAARAAGMPSIAALWGYRLHDDDPMTWNADARADTPEQLLDPAAWPVLNG